MFYSCRVHKINTYIIFNSTKCLHFVGITLFSCSQQMLQKKRHTTQTNRKMMSSLCIEQEEEKNRTKVLLYSRFRPHSAAHRLCFFGRTNGIAIRYYLDDLRFYSVYSSSACASAFNVILFESKYKLIKRIM